MVRKDELSERRDRPLFGIIDINFHERVPLFPFQAVSWLIGEGNSSGKQPPRPRPLLPP